MAAADATFSAPVAPGRLGAPAPAPEYLAYLDALRRWRDARRAELDRLDQAAMAAAQTAAFTPDITLAMGLWQAIANRYDQMVTTWDSGRVGPKELDELSRLTFGRLEAGVGGGLSVSFTEALTLSDALAAQLRARLSLDPLAAGAAARIPMFRAQLVRLRDLIKAAGSTIDPAVPASVDRLAGRLEGLASRALAGGDVAGEIAGFDADATKLERDLIVSSARRRDLVQDRARAEVFKAELVARAPALVELAARCTDKIAGAPRLAVPDPTTLGPVPEDRLLLDAYVGRLELVRTALDTVEAAYGAPLTERENLRGVVKAFQAKAMAARVVEQADLLAAWQQVRDTLWVAPCDLAASRLAVANYAALVRSATGSSPAPPIVERPPAGDRPEAEIPVEPIPTWAPEPPSTAEAPITPYDPVAAGAPVAADDSVSAGAPVTADDPVTVEPPGTGQPPMTAGAPTIADEPVAPEPPVALEPPDGSEQAVTPELPISSEEPMRDTQ